MCNVVSVASGQCVVSPPDECLFQALQSTQLGKFNLENRFPEIGLQPKNFQGFFLPKMTLMQPCAEPAFVNAFGVLVLILKGTSFEKLDYIQKNVLVNSDEVCFQSS